MATAAGLGWEKFMRHKERDIGWIGRGNIEGNRKER